MVVLRCSDGAALTLARPPQYVAHITYMAKWGECEGAPTLMIYVCNLSLCILVRPPAAHMQKLHARDRWVHEGEFLNCSFRQLLA